MKKVGLFLMFFIMFASNAVAQEFNRLPRSWKWLNEKEVIFSYDGSFIDSTAFVLNAVDGKRTDGVKAPEKYTGFPIIPEKAVNLTFSPDSTKLAFTRDNDLYVVDIASGKETRLTDDGSDVILNGYASWVYYEEILGRSSKYKAFWWSPDSRKIGFYRFDNSEVPMFPIYSAFPNPQGAASQSQSPKVTDLVVGGSLSETRYPKAGQTNPQVRIGIADISDSSVIWADFDPAEDQYFGIPFWGPDSREFFIARMPRLQNTLDLYSVDVESGSKKAIYHETYPTWLNWITSVIFTEKGLYMAREFETGWQQIYFLSYDGQVFRRLTDGPNWRISLIRVDEKKGDVYFTAVRDAAATQTLYKVDSKGRIFALTDPSLNVTRVSFSPEGRYFVASCSNSQTPTRIMVSTNKGGVLSDGSSNLCASFVDAEALRNLSGKVRHEVTGSGETFPVRSFVAADMKGPDFDASDYALPEMVYLTTDDGFNLPGMIVYPKNFDCSRKYPVHVEIYGGPDTPYVRNTWRTPSSSSQWWSDNGIIHITVDPRAAGHNGRKTLDMIYRQLTVWEVKDFCAWADALKALPYVQPDKIGVEGFSFGGTMTTMLLMQASDRFPYGIAGGGVYDWALYDSHYTERYMDTPQNNPEGYKAARVLEYVDGYPVDFTSDDSVMLKLTHGTGDDNVHHQNTLLLLDAMHRKGKRFDFMIYPDGLHGYRSYQGVHDENSNRLFWKRYLLGE